MLVCLSAWPFNRLTIRMPDCPITQTPECYSTPPSLEAFFLADQSKLPDTPECHFHHEPKIQRSHGPTSQRVADPEAQPRQGQEGPERYPQLRTLPTAPSHSKTVIHRSYTPPLIIPCIVHNPPSKSRKRPLTNPETPPRRNSPEICINPSLPLDMASTSTD